MTLEDNVTVSQPHSFYHNENVFKAYSLRTAAAALYDDTSRPLIQGRQIGRATFGQLVDTSVAYPADKAADIPDYLKDGVKRADGKPGDWDSGMGYYPDGSFINKPDEGNVVYKYFDSAQGKYIRTYPYFSWNDALVGETYFFPTVSCPRL